MAKTTRKFRFKEGQQSPTVEIGHGEYRRQFVATEQPFAVEDDAEAQILIGSGLFEEESESDGKRRSKGARETRPATEAAVKGEE